MTGKTLLAACLVATCLGRVAGAAETVPLVVPGADTLPTGELGLSVERGRAFLRETHQLLPEFVGNGLACKNCHLGDGTEVGVVADAAPLVGVVARFPQYSARDGAVTLIEQRINSCFQRSLNGLPLPLDHPAMVDMVAYMTWLSQGVPIGARVAGQGVPKLVVDKAPDPVHGKEVYEARCLPCHGANGGGLPGQDGAFLIPPLWGYKSFNLGAGMARHFTAAGFIKHNMPLGQGNSLTDEEAWDVAVFVDDLDHPDFPLRRQDWPKGGKPRDARD